MASQIFKVRWGIRGETFSLPIPATFEISTVNLSLRPSHRSTSAVHPLSLSFPPFLVPVRPLALPLSRNSPRCASLQELR